MGRTPEWARAPPELERTLPEGRLEPLGLESTWALLRLALLRELLRSRTLLPDELFTLPEERSEELRVLTLPDERLLPEERPLSEERLYELLLCELPEEPELRETPECELPEDLDPPLYEEEAPECPEECPPRCWAPRGRAKMVAATISAAILVKCFISQWY